MVDPVNVPVVVAATLNLIIRFSPAWRGRPA